MINRFMILRGVRLAFLSVRIFDLREKEHSTIVYESPEPDTPLLRLAWNNQDLRYMATILMDSNEVVILDIRSLTMPVAELERHQASVNAVVWAPQSGRYICSAGDDAQGHIWELPQLPTVGGSIRLILYRCTMLGRRLISCSGLMHRQEWVGIPFANKLQLLRA